jgi:hypothetical protein
VTEWRPSGPKPGKDGPGILYRLTQIAIKRLEVRNALHLGTPFERPDVTRAPVIILTARGPRRP